MYKAVWEHTGTEHKVTEVRHFSHQKEQEEQILAFTSKNLNSTSSW